MQSSSGGGSVGVWRGGGGVGPLKALFNKKKTDVLLSLFILIFI